jgi:hypothetical protein
VVLELELELELASDGPMLGEGCAYAFRLDDEENPSPKKEYDDEWAHRCR